jgi:hypothetical protein
MYKCPFCNFEYSDPSDLEGHLLENHFLSMQNYYEMTPIRSDEARCYKCGEYRPPLSYINHEGYYLPCWDCMSNYYERKQSVSMTQAAINDYYGKVLSDRYLQMFLIGDMYFNSTLTHTYGEFKDVLKSIHKHDRNKIWFLDWIKGFPKTICLENKDGIKAVLVDEVYDVLSSKNSIKINSWEILGPEIIPYDQRHHSRYNIFNPSAAESRNTKRLRLGDKCIKFYSIDGSDVKSIFSIKNMITGDIIRPEQLSEQDLIVSKLVLLRNKTFMRTICTIVNEITMNAGVFSDSAFLRNTVMMNPDKESIKINLSWTYEGKRNNFINISIL